MEAPPVVAQRIRRSIREAGHPTADTRPEPAELRTERAIEGVAPEARVERPAAPVSRALSSAPVLEAPVEPIHRVVQTAETQIQPMASLQEKDRQTPRSPARSESEQRRERPRSDGRADLRPKPGLVAMRGNVMFRPPVSPAVTLPDVDQAQVPDAPVIHVTIGRVEIRATVPQAPARKPPVGSPAMSLEEYLKQRNGASRE